METALLQALPLLTQSSLLSLSKSHFFKFQLTFYLVTKLHSRSLRQGFGLCLKIPLEQRDLLSLVNEASDPGPFGPLTLGPCLSLVCAVGSWETDAWKVLSEKQSSFRL